MSENQPNINAGGNFVRFGQDISIRLDQPLERFNNGGARAYAAYDENDKARKLVAIVAGIREFPRWGDEKNYKALADPSFLRLLGSGIVRWPLDGQQKYVFLYQGDIGECLVRFGEFSKTSWRHPDIINFFVQPMTRILKEMADRQFCHGAIRPDNIFYAVGDKSRPVTLGDCLSVHSLSAQPALFLPPDKASAHPMGRGAGTPSDDVYAFGVSLALFLRRGDELSGLSDVEILRKKIEIGSYAAIIGAERFQASFLELLRGVLHDDPELRWTVDDIFAWLDGTRLTPAALAKRKKAARPISFMNKKYYFTDLLAVDLCHNPNEVVELVGSDVLGQWIDKSLSDKLMHESYSDILDRVGDINQNQDLLVTYLMMLFNPVLPIFYNKYYFTYDGLGGLMAYEAYLGNDVSVFKDAILKALPDRSLIERSLSQNEVVAYVKQYDKCRNALKKKNLGDGVEKAIYMLCNHAPCLSPKYKGYFINSPQSALVAFEKMSAEGGQISLYLDRHAIAFFSVLSASFMSKCLPDLNSPQKERQVAGNLRFLAFMHRQARDVTVNAIAAVFMDSLADVYKVFKNKSLRKQVEDAVNKAAMQGDLAKMSALLDDESTLAKDHNAYHNAMREYRYLQNEYDQYNRSLARKATYGTTNGRDLAAVVSWGIATLITLMVVLAFLSGYQIF